MDNILEIYRSIDEKNQAVYKDLAFGDISIEESFDKLRECSRPLEIPDEEIDIMIRSEFLRMALEGWDARVACANVNGAYSGFLAGVMWYKQKEEEIRKAVESLDDNLPES